MLQQPLKLDLEVRKTIFVFRALYSHLQLQVSLLTQLDREAVRGLREPTVADLVGAVLNDEVNLMRRTPDAQDLMNGLLVHQRDERAGSPPHRDLTDCAN